MNNFFSGVPFSGCEGHLPEEYIIATREDEAVAMAVGALLAGKKPLVFMQDSGIGNCLDVLTSLCKPYGLEVDLLINQRLEPEHHKLMGKNYKKILKLIGYDTFRSC